MTKRGLTKWISPMRRRRISEKLKTRRPRSRRRRGFPVIGSGRTKFSKMISPGSPKRTASTAMPAWGMAFFRAHRAIRVGFCDSQKSPAAQARTAIPATGSHGNLRRFFSKVLFFPAAGDLLEEIGNAVVHPQIDDLPLRSRAVKIKPPAHRHIGV